MTQDSYHYAVIARAIDRDHVYDIWFAGGRDIVRETYDSTMRIGRSAFEALGIERETAEKMIDVFNEMDRQAMIEVAPVHVSGLAPHENEAYLAKVRELLPVYTEDAEKKMAEVLAEAAKKADSA